MNRTIEDLHFFIKHSIALIESTKNIKYLKEDYWKIDGNGLYLKYISNILTIAYLVDKTKTKILDSDLNIFFLDYLSIFSISRSALETYLTFNYLFLVNKSESEKKFRHSLWTLSSLSNRQRQISFSKSMDIIKNNEMKEIENLVISIKKSQYFTGENISNKTRNEIKKGKKIKLDWKPDGGWTKLANLAEFNSKFFDDAYNIYSAITHSDQVIINYLDKPNKDEIANGLTKVAINILNVITAAFIDDYDKVYSQSRYQSDKNKLAEKIIIYRNLHTNSYELINLNQVKK